MMKLWKSLFIVSAVLLVLSGFLAFNLSNSLTTTRSELESTETKLTSTEQQLTVKILELSATKTELDNTKLQLGTTQNQLTAKETELALVNNQLTSVKTQLQTVTDEKSQLLSSYTSMRNTINIRFGDTLQDMRSFITPLDTTLAAKVQEITGGYSEDVNEYWDDWERLYRWVVKNIKYSYDSYLPVLPEVITGTFNWGKDFWRMPIETLTDKTGDCEDMALLLASMIKNYNQGKFAVWLIEIVSDSDNTAHMAVACPVQGGRLTILDPAGNYYTGMSRYGSLNSESASIAINDWLSHWSSQIPGAFVKMVFSESEDQQFSSTAEFITWLSQR